MAIPGLESGGRYFKGIKLSPRERMAVVCAWLDFTCEVFAHAFDFTEHIK